MLSRAGNRAAGSGLPRRGHRGRPPRLVDRRPGIPRGLAAGPFGEPARGLPSAGRLQRPGQIVQISQARRSVDPAQPGRDMLRLHSSSSLGCIRPCDARSRASRPVRGWRARSVAGGAPARRHSHPRSWGRRLRRSSRDTVYGERPSSRAIARTPRPVRRSVAIRRRSSKEKYRGPRSSSTTVGGGRPALGTPPVTALTRAPNPPARLHRADSSHDQLPVRVLDCQLPLPPASSHIHTPLCSRVLRPVLEPACR
jgi:hypothetical protein